MRCNPYDEVTYRSVPIEWTSPERMSLAAMLHGGPRPSGFPVRVLELGCGDGANLLPMAYHRPRSSFVGVDGAANQVAAARRCAAYIDVRNVRFIHSDFEHVDDVLDGDFDYIIGHGIFSWISDEAREALLALCSSRLRPTGLLYLNYNAYPGWSLRGMVRDFVLAHTRGHACGNLFERALRAQDAARLIVTSFDGTSFASGPYSQLIADEFRFLAEQDASYVAHEYLSEHNRPYWRSEFLVLLEARGLHYVADADFNYDTGRVSPGLAGDLQQAGLIGRAIEDTVDLLSHRQLHSALLTPGPSASLPLSAGEFESLHVASCLVASAARDGNRTFLHPASRVEVETREDSLADALLALGPRWPASLPVRSLFNAPESVRSDLLLLFRNGLIDLRLDDADACESSDERLVDWESSRGYVTTRWHQRCALPA